MSRRFSAVDARYYKGLTSNSIIQPHYSLADQLFVQPEPRLDGTVDAQARAIEMTPQEVAVALSHVEVWKPNSRGRSELRPGLGGLTSTSAVDSPVFLMMRGQSLSSELDRVPFPIWYICRMRKRSRKDRGHHSLNGCSGLRLGSGSCLGMYCRGVEHRNSSACCRCGDQWISGSITSSESSMYSRRGAPSLYRDQIYHLPTHTPYYRFYPRSG